MKVAIWGSYNYGNYGDDVMAIMFAKHLQALGVTPYVYRLNQELADFYDIKTTNSLKEAFQGAKFGFVGGGTVILEPLFGPIGSEMNEDTRQLWEIISVENCPLFCISVGGDGTLISDRKLSFYQWKLLESENFHGGTVRLGRDAELLEKLGKEVSLFPDVVLSLADFWPTAEKTQNSKIPQVGICLNNTLNTQKFASALSLISFLRRHASFHFIHTHLPAYNLIKGSLLPNTKTPFVSLHLYKNPAETIRFISSLDLLISNKLHPNVTALVSGVPFCSLDLRSKTHAVLDSFGLETARFHPNSRRDLFNLFIKLSSKEKILKFQEHFDFHKIRQQKDLSRGHFQYLTNLVDHFRNK